mmetsp:Transcript_2594/g.9426  ORF Transcript_2594/g.9426 Transcript_2594/m.9426 type:complete len:248 (+) Transcript_2594:561-1304(+)
MCENTWIIFPRLASTATALEASPMRDVDNDAWASRRSRLDRALNTSSVSSAINTFGNSHNPASKPFAGRFCNKNSSSSASARRLRMTTNARCSSRFGAFFAVSGSSVTLNAPLVRSSSSTPLHHARNGHCWHFGFFGAHVVAPSSIIAWLKSPARAGSTNASATARISFAAVPFNGSPLIIHARVNTRYTLPSTAAAGVPNAMDATALAVYGPTPGTLSKPSTLRGYFPPSLSRTYLAPSSKYFARL